MILMLWAVTYGALVNILSRQPSARTFLSSRSPSEDDFAESPTIQIWDHVFKDSVLKQVKQVGDARSHGFTSVIDRQDTAATRTPLETAILAILDQLEAQDNGATTSSTFHAASSQPILQKQRFVEYWWSEKVRMLEAHRDIDEEYNKRHQIPTALGSSEKVGLQRCPTFGHVLYVDMIGDFLAPTLVWKEQGTPKLDFDSGALLGGPPKTLESLSVVPSVTNRLLRFRGDCLHAVAYPIEDLLGPPVSVLEEEGLPKGGCRRMKIRMGSQEGPQDDGTTPLIRFVEKFCYSTRGKWPQSILLWKQTQIAPTLNHPFWCANDLRNGNLQRLSSPSTLLRSIIRLVVVLVRRVGVIHHGPHYLCRSWAVRVVDAARRISYLPWWTDSLLTRLFRRDVMFIVFPLFRDKALQ